MIPVDLCRKFAIAVYSYTELSYDFDHCVNLLLHFSYIVPGKYQRSGQEI